MGMSANIHNATKMKALGDDECAWLQIENGDGDHVVVFMPFDQALRMALAFHQNPPAPIDHAAADAADYDDGNITP